MSGIAFADLSSGLVAYYPFDGDATDASGNGHNGTIAGNPAYETGKSGQAIALDGEVDAEDYVNIGTSSDFNLTQYSFCAWVKPQQSADGYIISKARSINMALRPSSADSGQNDELLLKAGVWIGGHWVKEHSSDSNPQDPIPPDQWTHTCITFGDGYMKFYVDGQLMNSYALSKDPDQTSNPVYIGFEADAGGSNAFEGSLDEVRIYNRVLTLTEIQEVYADSGDDGNTDGGDEGYDDGYTDGYTDGYQAGLAACGPPERATVVSPSGSATNPVTFTWNSIDNAGWYNLYIWDGDHVEMHNQWYETEDNRNDYPEVSCSGGTCSVTLSATTLSSGNHEFYVRAWNEYGYGEWSEGLAFTITQ